MAPGSIASSARKGSAIDSRTLAVLAAQAALEKHAEDVVILDLRALSSVTNFFVIATALSARQLSALEDHLERTLQTHGCAVWHTEGMSSTGLQQEPLWLLMDFGVIVVHLFDPPTREFYQLERLWADAPRVSLPIQ